MNTQNRLVKIASKILEKNISVQIKSLNSAFGFVFLFLQEFSTPIESYLGNHIKFNMSQLIRTQQLPTKKVLFDDAVVLLGHDGPVLTSKFSLDGSCIVSGGMDRTIRLWHLPTNEYEVTPNFGVMDGHKSAVTSINWKDLETLFSTSADGTVGFWDATIGECTNRGKGHTLAVNDCSTASYGVCISVGDDGSLRTWDERIRSEVSVIESSYPLVSCALSSDGSIAYAAGIDPIVNAYDLSTKKLLWSCPSGRETVTGISISSDDSRLVIRSSDGVVKTINCSNVIPAGVSRIGPSYDGPSSLSQQNVVRVCFSRDDVYIAAGSDATEACLWNTSQRKIQTRFTDHKDAILEVAFHPTEDIFLSCSNDGTIIVRQLQT